MANVHPDLEGLSETMPRRIPLTDQQRECLERLFREGVLCREIPAALERETGGKISARTAARWKPIWQFDETRKRMLRELNWPDTVVMQQIWSEDLKLLGQFDPSPGSYARRRRDLHRAVTRFLKDPSAKTMLAVKDHCFLYLLESQHFTCRQGGATI